MGHSYQMALSNVLHEIQQANLSSKKFIGTSFDNQGALVSSDHFVLLQKLVVCGLPLYIIAWVLFILAQR